MCDFETKACGWSDDYLNPNVWKIQNGEPVSPNSGPLTDHTTASGKQIIIHAIFFNFQFIKLSF